jgi:uncharacterized membrane protein
MNSAELHLLVNHFPIVAIIIAFGLLTGGMIFKSSQIKRAALVLIIVAAATALVANSTGKGAEEIVEEMQGITHAQIHEHEEMAEKFFFLSAGLGLFASITFFLDWKNKPLKKFFYPLILILIALNIFLGYKTGKTGGEIRHTEVRKGFVAAPEEK